MTCIRIVSLAVTGLIVSSQINAASAQHWHHGSGYHSGHVEHIIGLHRVGRYLRNPYSYGPTTTWDGSAVTAWRPESITFGGFSHVDDLAVRLEELANQFCIDLYYNYSHNPGFPETYREAYRVLEVARFIHDSEHRHDRRAIQEQLGGLDALFHHVQDDVRGWSRHHQRQVGYLGIQTKMDLLESTLHHLMSDVGVRLTAGIGEQAPPPDGGPGLAPSPEGVLSGP